MVWLKSYNHGISYDEFRRTRIYRSLWDEEKRRFEEMGASFILPVVCDGELTAITIFSNDASEGKTAGAEFQRNHLFWNRCPRCSRWRCGSPLSMQRWRIRRDGIR